MTQITELPALDPVSVILPVTARLGPVAQPRTLPCSAGLLDEAIEDNPIPRLNVKAPHSLCDALHTIITLRVERAREGRAPATVHRTERIIARCHGRPAARRQDCRFRLSHRLRSSCLKYGGGCRLGIHAGQPALPEPAAEKPVCPRLMPNRFSAYVSRARNVYVSRPRVGVYGIVRISGWPP